MLRSLFLDMNAFFASAEQHCQPRYRGRPLVVVPMVTDTTCCLAVSYEARPFGIRTGTSVAEARRLCPQLVIVESRTDVYVRLHHRIIEAVEAVIPVTRVWSIDEMECRLWREDRDPAAAEALARRVKAAIADRVGPTLRCSVGLAPNQWLAKIASDMQKPDGLTRLLQQDLPDRLFQLQLTDLPGIGANMERRLNSFGIHTVQQLCERSESELIQAWGSIVGGRWWHLLRGEDISAAATHTQSIGHEHVLPPAFRTREGAHGVLTHLIHKAAARARSAGYLAGQMTIRVQFLGTGEWRVVPRIAPRANDTLTLVRAFERVWPERFESQQRIFKVSVTLHDIRPTSVIPQSLFTEDRVLQTLAETMDSINRLFGSQALVLGGMHKARESAPARIAFGSIPPVQAPHSSLTENHPQQCATNNAAKNDNSSMERHRRADR